MTNSLKVQEASCSWYTLDTGSLFAGMPVPPASLQPIRLITTATGLRHWVSNWCLSLERPQSGPDSPWEPVTQ